MKEKIYTEEDLRKAFQAGSERGAFIQSGSYFDAPLDENEYIESLKPQPKENCFFFTYSFLRRKLNKSDLEELSGGHETKDSDVFQLTENQAKKFNLI